MSATPGVTLTRCCWCSTRRARWRRRAVAQITGRRALASQRDGAHAVLHQSLKLGHLLCAGAGHGARAEAGVHERGGVQRGGAARQAASRRLHRGAEAQRRVRGAQHRPALPGEPAPHVHCVPRVAGECRNGMSVFTCIQHTLGRKNLQHVCMSAANCLSGLLVT